MRCDRACIESPWLTIDALTAKRLLCLLTPCGAHVLLARLLDVCGVPYRDVIRTRDARDSLQSLPLSEDAWRVVSRLKHPFFYRKSCPSSVGCPVLCTPAAFLPSMRSRRRRIIQATLRSSTRVWAWAWAWASERSETCSRKQWKAVLSRCDAFADPRAHHTSIFHLVGVGVVVVESV